MSIQNGIAAKVLGEIIARGMSMSETDLAENVRSEAITALDRVSAVMKNPALDADGKTARIDEIIKEYGF